MAQQATAAALQTCNNQLVERNVHFNSFVLFLFRSSSRSVGVEQLSRRRDELERQIRLGETEKRQLEEQIYTLGEKLSRLNENLAQKVAARNDYDRTLGETEKIYAKIVESSQTLVNVNVRSHHLRSFVRSFSFTGTKT